MTVPEIVDAADAIEYVWTEFVDEVVIEAAQEAVRALHHLAAVIEGER